MKLGGTSGVNFKITKKDKIGTGNNPHYTTVSDEGYFFYVGNTESFLDLANTTSTGVAKWLDPKNHRTVNGAYLEYSYDAYEANTSDYNIKVKPNDTLPYDFLRSSAPVKLNYKFNFNNHFKLYDVKYASNLRRYTAEKSVYGSDIIVIRPSSSGIYVNVKDTFGSVLETKWTGSGTVYTFNYNDTPLSTENYGINVYNSKNDLTLSSRLNVSTAKILDVIELDVIADSKDTSNAANSRYSNKTLFTKKYNVPNDMIAIVPIREIGLGGNVIKANYTFDYVYSVISLNNSTVTVKQAIRKINYVSEFGDFFNNILWDKEPYLYRIFSISVTPQEIVYLGQKYNDKVKFAVIDLSSFGSSTPLYTLPSKFGS